MTIDKIKFYMDITVFDFWCNCKNIAVIEKAKKTLKSEIESKMLTDIKYIAELNLLNYLSL